MAHSRVKTRRIETPNQFLLLEILKCTVPLLHLQTQIDRLKRRKSPHALATFPAPANRIRFRRIARISDF